MTNGDRIRRTGDSELAEFILNNLNAFKKCSMCTVGLDGNRCKNPDADCEEKIFEWLGSEEQNRKKNYSYQNK